MGCAAFFVAFAIITLATEFTKQCKQYSFEPVRIEPAGEIIKSTGTGP